MRRYILIGLMLFFGVSAYSTEINSYAKVESINGTRISCTHLIQNSDGFVDNMLVMFYQVQDDVIGSVNNSSSFGNLGDIRSAGLIDFVRISNLTIDESARTISFDINSPLSESFYVGPNSSLQVISFPELNDGFSTTENIEALPWDGNVGGVVCFEVDGNFVMNHDIDANGDGFRGGDASNAFNEAAAMHSSTYISSNLGFGEKGESIYKISDQAYTRGKSKILNGGGGGNPLQNGGAGGANYSDGGLGGIGAGSEASHYSYGGLGFHSQIETNFNRFLLGGGGGGGHAELGNATDGANGGGFIFIKAESILVNGSRSMEANGASASSTASNVVDGAGGAGAGGSIGLVCDTILFTDLTSTLTFEVNGGEGGSISSSTASGEGGGGGQGVVKFYTVDPDDFTRAIISSNSGDSGLRDNLPATTLDDSRSGEQIGTGSYHIDYLSFGDSELLPIELYNINLNCSDDFVTINWTTASETNNEMFILESSIDLEIWRLEQEIAGAGNSQINKQYIYTDGQPNLYYRLSQMDYDGTVTNVKTIVNNCYIDNIRYLIESILYTDNKMKINVMSDISMKLTSDVQLYNIGTATEIQVQDINLGDNDIELTIPNLSAGAYIVRIIIEDQVLVEKLVVSQ